MPDVRWDVLTIGCLSRNRYWGESDDRAYRPALCTSVLLRADGHAMVMDPGLEPPRMTEVLDRRAGLHADAVATVFLTHFHGDHRAGVEAFPHARWLMAPGEIAHWDRQLPPDGPDRRVLQRLEPAGEEPLPGVRLLRTPGHTPEHASLLFESEGARVAVAGDAAMTRDFFLHDDYYFNTVDPDAAVCSIRQLREIADIVVPGHDNYFIVRDLGTRS